MSEPYRPAFWVEVLLLVGFWAAGAVALVVLGRWEVLVVPALLTPVCVARIRRERYAR